MERTTPLPFNPPKPKSAAYRKLPARAEMRPPPTSVVKLQRQKPKALPAWPRPLSSVPPGNVPPGNVPPDNVPGK